MLNSQSNYFLASSVAMVKSEETIADRVVRLREALDYKGRGGQLAFALKLDIFNSSLNMIEKGTPMSKDIAFRLVKLVPGLTLDWLYFGKPDGLTLEIQRLLGIMPSGPGKRTTAPR